MRIWENKREEIVIEIRRTEQERLRECRKVKEGREVLEEEDRITEKDLG